MKDLDEIKRITGSMVDIDHNLTTNNTSAIRNSSVCFGLKISTTPVVSSNRLINNLSRMFKKKNTMLKLKIDKEMDKDFEVLSKTMSIKRKRFSESEKKTAKGPYIPSFTSSMRIFKRQTN